MNRNPFKIASSEEQKKMLEEQEKKTKLYGNSSSDWYTLDRSGLENRIQLIVVPEKDPEAKCYPSVLRCTIWMDVLVEKKDDDGKPTGEFERKRRPLFNSRIHGGTEKDIVEEYQKMAEAYLMKKGGSRDEMTKICPSFTGYRDKSGKWNPGIRFYSNSYILYVYVDGEVKLLEVYKDIWDSIFSIGVDQEENKEIKPYEPESIYSGFPLLLSYNKENKKWRVVLEQMDIRKYRGMSVDEAYNKYLQEISIPDSIISSLSEKKSLMEMYTNIYDRTDFERALEAVLHFDKTNGLNICQTQEFQDIAAEIEGYFPSREEDNGEDLPFEDTSKEVDLPEEKEEGEKPLEKMNREELKRFIMDKELDILVKKSMTDEDIRNLIREELNPTPVAELPEEEDDEPVPFDEKEVPKSVQSVKERLLNKNKK